MAEGMLNERWTIYSCSQNLPAILNDPKRGKQKDFFTRTWGDSFVETAAVPESSRLEDIPNSYFVPYCKKLRKRYRKLDRKRSSPQVDPSNPLFPGLVVTREFLKPETSPIPRIFFTQNFAISNSETFREVFEVTTEGLPSKMIQDKLSHYLDLVEVGLAQQISKKSSAFFNAVSSQDKVTEKVYQASHCVKQIKQTLAQAKADYVEAPRKIIALSHQKSNMILVLQKMQLMSTVHQAQRAIQSLLGNSDYVGALDLISTTQEVLKQELQGLVSFRHLDSQLVEIRNAIEKMLRAELERNLSGDLNRPIEQIHAFYDKDRLVSIMLGHLRLGKVAPIVTVLAKEIATAMTATCKQTLIEAVSESDSRSDSLIGSTAVQLAIPQLDSSLWLKMIEQLSQRLVILLGHIRDVIVLFQDCGDSAFRHDSSGTRASSQPPNASCDRDGDDSEPLVSIELYSNLTTELSLQLEKTTGTADGKFTGILRARKTWAARSEFVGTLLICRNFIDELEAFLRTLTGSTDRKTFRYTSVAEMKSQTNEFFHEFHKRQLEAVNVALDREKWRTAPEEKVQRFWPITDIKELIDLAEESSLLGSSSSSVNSLSSSIAEIDVNANTGSAKEVKNHQSPPVQSSSQPIRTSEVFFVILYIVAEYSYLLNLTQSAEVILGLVELLRGANVRIANLVLGAGAVELKTIKSVTVSNLAVVVRGLDLVGSTLFEIRTLFQETLPAKNLHLLKHLDTVQAEMMRHADDLEAKMLFIITQVIDAELNNWEARPPVPSNSVNAVSRNLTKFKEVIAPMLTPKQVSDVFLRVDKAFRTKLKERIGALGILKDGGPRHGVVTSEMMHYAENLRKLNVLPANVISNAGLTQELWSSNTKTNTTTITSNGVNK